MAKISNIEDSTTTSGSGNAAQLDLGSYRDEVDILVNGSGAGWTVTVEHKDANGDWIRHSQFAQDGTDDDTLQVETKAPEMRAYFDTDVTRLTMYAKGDN